MGLGGNRNYQPNGVVKFPIVMSDVGDAYNAGTGEFTCNVAGWYLFTFSLLSQKGRLGIAHLMLRNKKQAGVRAAGIGQHFGHSSNTVILQCNQGDKVFVQVHHKHNAKYFFDDGGMYGTFSAVLLNEE